MARSFFKHAKITGIGAVVPKKTIRLEDELEYFGNDIKKARRMTKMVGLDCRRVVDPGVTAADLCQQAAENLLADLSVDRQSIEALIFISQGPDHYLPATACILQHKLGLPTTCAAFDVNQGCAAYTYGLWLASSLLESRAAGRVLLLAGEAPSITAEQNNRIVTPVFGDSGTATLLEYSPEERPSWFLLGADGSGAEALIIPAGQMRLPPPSTTAAYEPLCRPVVDQNGTPWRLVRTYMDGAAIFDFTLNVVPDHIKELLRFSDTSPEEIDRLVLHQANKQILEAVAEKAGFPLEKTPRETFTKYGNQAGASIPGVICDALAEEVRTSRPRLLLSGFGVGLAWASAVLDLDHICCTGMQEYETPPGHRTPEEYRDYWLRKLAGQDP